MKQSVAGVTKIPQPLSVVKERAKLTRIILR